MLFTFSVIFVICFVLIKLLPVTEADQFGQDMQLVLLRREQLGYNKPIFIQLFIFLERALFHGDWGISEKLYFGRDVWTLFVTKLPNTILVNVYAMLLSVPIGLALGIFAAMKKNKWQDHLISTLTMVVISVPSYVYAFLLQYFLCYKLQWFDFRVLPVDPENGITFFSWPMFKSMLPAVFCLSFGSIAGFTRYTRAELTEVLTSEFMLLARAKGLTKGQATVRHALRNAMVPIFPMILGEFVSILSGSLIIESIFTVGGVGSLYVDSINCTPPDYNIFLLLTAFYTLVSLTAGIVVDLSYGFIDPRIRMGAKK